MLNEDYKDILLALKNEAVDFILVGAYALAAHGYPRATLDIDIWVQPTKENAQKIFQALTKFGAPLHQVELDDFEKDDTVFQIGVAPRRIDILTGITGVDYKQAKSNALQTGIGGIQLNVISIQDLIQNKSSTGRLKDLDDVEQLKKHLKENS